MAREEPNPYDQFKAPPRKTKEEVNPFEQFKTTKAERERTGMDKVTQIAGVTTDAFMPYATAAAAGAAAGGIPTGGIGAIPGAGAGMLALGVGDLGTSIYNLGASAFGGDRVPLPSETISQGYRSVGIGRAPETTGERVYSDTLKAAVGAGGTAKGFQLAENVATSPQTRNFMNMMGQNIRGQIGAGAGAGGAPSVATNYFDVTDPTTLMGLSLAAGVAGNKAATPSVKPVTAAALKDESGKLYKQMEAEGVQIAPQAMTDLDATVRTKLTDLRYDPDTDNLVNQALDLFGKKSGKPMSFEMLEEFRKSIRDLPYTQSGAGRGTPKERAIIAALDDTIDDFMERLTPAQTTFGGGKNAATVNFGGREFNLGFGAPNRDPSTAAALLKKARDVRARGYRTETLEDAFTRATATSKALNSNKSFPQALRDEFGKIAKDPRKLSKFDKPTQDLIKKVANGTATQKVFAVLGKLSPSATLFGMRNIGYGGAGYMAPFTTATVAGVTSSAKGAANRMTRTQANRALVSAAQPGGNIRPGGSGYFLLSPIAQQNVMAQDRANQRKR
jgi:hypothetical protein